MAIKDQSLSTWHINDHLADYEIARSGFFTLIVNDIDNIVKATYSGESTDGAADTDKIANAQDYLRLNVLSTKVPHFTVATHEIRRGNEVVKFAGIPTFDEGEIVVDDVVGLDTKAILMAWQNLTYNIHTRKGGRMKDYKKKCTLVEYTQDYEPIRQWTLYGCFPTGLSEDNFDRANDGPRKITMPISYDRAVPETFGKIGE